MHGGTWGLPEVVVSNHWTTGLTFGVKLTTKIQIVILRALLKSLVRITVEYGGLLVPLDWRCKLLVTEVACVRCNVMQDANSYNIEK